MMNAVLLFHIGSHTHTKTHARILTAGDDYIPISQTLTFSPSETIITVRVNLLDDDASEGSEDFLLQLVLVDEQLGRPGVVSQASVLLLDNESEFKVVSACTDLCACVCVCANDIPQFFRSYRYFHQL